MATTLKLPTPTGYTSDDVWFQAALAEAAEWIPEVMWPTSMWTYATMRRDPQLAALLNAWMLPVRRATWQVSPDGVRPEVAQLVADDLGLSVAGQDKPGAARVRGVSWAEHLRAALLMLIYGHAGFELGAELRDNRARLTVLAERVPQTILRINVGRNGELTSIEQTAMPGEREPVAIDAGRLLWYCHDREGAAWQGNSILRAAYGPWLLKREMWRVLATSNRRFGMGVPVVEWDNGTNPGPPAMAAAQQAASAYRGGETAGGAMPPGARLVLKGLEGGAPDTLGFVNYLDQQMSRMALAGFMDLGQTAHGSRALGSTFVDLMLLAIQSVADQIADTVTRQVAARLVAWNWGEAEPVPAVTVGDVGESNEVTAEALSALLQSGALQADPTLEADVRRRWKLPERTTPYVQPVKPAPKPVAASRPARTVRAAASRDLTAQEQAAGLDPVAQQQAQDEAVTQARDGWSDLVAPLVVGLAAAAAAAVVAGTLADLGSLAPDADAVAAIAERLTAAMTTAAEAGAQQVVDMGTHQGVIVAVPVDLASEQIGQVARATAGLIASGYASAAARTALQAAGPDATEAGIDEAVTAALDGISTADTGLVADAIGSAVHTATTAAQHATIAANPPTLLVASEVGDSNTCAPCSEADGREYKTLAAAQKDYPIAGNVGCLGGLRCRGRVIPIWS